MKIIIIKFFFIKNNFYKLNYNNNLLCKTEQEMNSLFAIRAELLQ